MRAIVFVCASAFFLPLAPVLAAGAAAQAGVLLVQVQADGRPLAGASVRVLSDGTERWQATSDREGRARVAVAQAGTFTVRVEATGHRPHESTVTVRPGHIQVLEVALEVEPFELEGISVRATGRVQIKRDDTEFSTTVDQDAINLLPVMPDAQQLVELTPGARAGHVWGGANFQANSYLIDGLSVNHPGLGGGLVQPSVNWIERMEVRGLGSGAEHGGFQGGQVNVITRTGTNDFRGSVHTSFQNEALSASNLVTTEIGAEVASRFEVEAEAAGAIVRDRLFYFVGGQRVEQDARVLNHVRSIEGRFAPDLEERSESKVFGKLTWTPGQADQLEVSGGYFNFVADHHGMTGYEAPGATTAYSAPTAFGTAAWRRALGDWGSLEARVNSFSRDERHDPYGGTDVPAVREFSLNPPYTTHANAPFTLRSAPASTSGRLAGTFRLRTGMLEQSLRIGAEYTRGSFLDRRLRSGGMTWMPTRSARLDPEDPATWTRPGSTTIPTQWGGEVHLDADVANTAVFAQAALELGSRVVLSPGIRWGRWQGWLTPVSGTRFLAVEDDAVDPRLGAMVELTGDGSLVAKAHWGRYHQDMIAQMFDRAAGSDVFTNEEIWYYRGDLASPGTRFTVAERDALAEQGLFTRESVVVLNETGPVHDYRQPYMDQWLVAVEKQFHDAVKIEALYTRRSNRDMIALVDRNRESNYTRYERVRVYDAGGTPLPFEGGSVVLSEVYIPNWMMVERIRYCSEWPDLCSIPPEMTAADTLSLTWNPDYVLTNAPDGRREFGQLQLTVKVERPTWGGSFSVAATKLEGNLDNVSGYANPEEYSAGPYVRVNEGVNSYGLLPNFSEREAKVSVWGTLPWRLRGGIFWTYASGDHYSPRFRISGMGFYRYKIRTGASAGQRGSTSLPGEELDFALFSPLEGHYVFVGPRGRPQHRRRANLDLRLERLFHVQGIDLGLSLDLFNATGFETITRVNTMVNNGRNYYYWIEDEGVFGSGSRVRDNEYYGAPLERVGPRVLRLGMKTYF